MYHYGKDAYISIKIEREGVRPKYYFAFTSIANFLEIMQPNYTEITEGRITKYNLEDGSWTWFGLIATFTRIAYQSDTVAVAVKRARYLVLSLLRVVDGFDCRIEVYEDRCRKVVLPCVALCSLMLRYAMLCYAMLCYLMLC